MDQLGFKPLFSIMKDEPKTQDEANRILEEIQGRKGHLSESTIQWLDTAPVQHRHEIVQKFNAFHRDAVKLIKSTTTLNSSDGHFIRELLQNADDAKYDDARMSNKQAWIKFKVMNESIIIETNEDGFTRADVEAICETGESSKKRVDSHKHIGEKGIGFKSIFRIAEKVHISSGLWHFHFKHAEGDDGLGMVTPLLDPPLQLPKGIGTRITVRLNQRYQDNLANIVREFERIPDTIIFFLSNISHLEIEINLAGATRTITTITNTALTASGRKQVTKAVRTIAASAQTQAMETRQQYYQVFSGGALEMPADKRRRSNKATVTLAFPVDSSSTQTAIEPEGHYVFAFLPMYRKVQLSFLIQSDFITADNRESTIDCAWNDRLLRAIADTFCDAVAHFCELGILTYSWPKYIPTLPIDGFLENLRAMIVTRLRSRQVFCTWTSESFKLPTELRRLPHTLRNEGMPLLADRKGRQEIYLAPEYEAYGPLLKELGVCKISSDEAFDRLVDDVSSLSSRFRSAQTTVTWHEAMASWLLELLENPKTVRFQQKLVLLNIVPLTSGMWRAASDQRLFNNPLYFPSISGIDVPRNIGYDLVDVQACLPPMRARLFSQMGIGSCNITNVIKGITRFHSSSLLFEKKDTVDHLYILYRFKVRMHQVSQKLWITTMSKDQIRVSPEVYLQSEEPHSTNWLLRNMVSFNEPKDLAISRWLLDSAYFDSRLIDRPDDKIAWRTWLTQEVGIREYPALTRQDINGKVVLSSILRSVLEASSQLFLSTLRALWSSDYATGSDNPIASREVLEDCAVHCRNGHRCRLVETYLPSDEVMSRARELGIVDHSNILSLDLRNKPFSINEWAFLKELGVKDIADVHFYLQALHSMQVNDCAKSPLLAYDYIGANTQKKQASYLHSQFVTHQLVHCPSSSLSTTRSGAWYRFDQCVWEGPAILTVKRPIAPYYKSNVNAVHLFKNILELADASWHDLIDQLEDARSANESNFSQDEASAIYVEIFAMKDVKWQQVRSKFSIDELVFVSGNWYSLDACLWTSSVHIEGRPILANIYPQLESFFTQKLGVQKASVGHILSELTRKAKLQNGLNVAEAKTFLKQISNMLAFEPPDISLQEQLAELSVCRFLPVRKGTGLPQLVTCSSDFAVRDHYEYSQAFADSCTFLDFSFEEVPQITKLLEALPLDTNYISELVEARPSIGNDAVLHKALSNELNQKAPCLFSCAYKYHSRYATEHESSLFEQLQTLQVFSCSAIATELVIELDGIEITSLSKEAQVLIEVRDGKTSLFVPESERQQRSSFRSKLPDELLRLMDVETNSERSSAIAFILLSPLSDLEDVMKTQNIPVIPWLDHAVYRFASFASNEFSATSVSALQPEHHTEQQSENRSSNTASDDERNLSVGAESLAPSADSSDTTTLSSSGFATSTCSLRSANAPPTTLSSSFVATPSTKADFSRLCSSPFRQSTCPVFGQPSSSSFSQLSGFGRLSSSVSSQPSKPIFSQSSSPGFSQTPSSGDEFNRSFFPRFFFPPADPTIPPKFGPLSGSSERREPPAWATGQNMIEKCSTNPATSTRHTAVQQEANYKALLDQVMKCAIKKRSSSQRAQPPKVFDFSDIASTLPPALDPESVFGPPGLVQNFRIGAAGELFVFEYLKKLGLPDFGIGNWQSRIRKYVKVHPDYVNMESWDQRETADIVYEDCSGLLKEWLRTVSCNGFPKFPSSGSFTSGFDCKYYIEVKTTTASSCDEKFYMSSGEYDLMRRLESKSDVDPDAIYVIVRVFGLMTKDIRFKVFVDPWRSQNESMFPVTQPALRFEVGKWRIHPTTTLMASH